MWRDFQRWNRLFEDWKLIFKNCVRLFLCCAQEKERISKFWPLNILVSLESLQNSLSFLLFLLDEKSQNQVSNKLIRKWLFTAFELSPKLQGKKAVPYLSSTLLQGTGKLFFYERKKKRESTNCLFPPNLNSLTVFFIVI